MLKPEIDDGVETLAAEIHKVYCIAYAKRFRKPYHTNGDYSKLDEATKEYDRAFARWHMEKMKSCDADARALLRGTGGE